MKAKVEVTYVFDIEYEHKQHLEDIKKELLSSPTASTRGAGRIGSKVYPYS